MAAEEVPMELLRVVVVEEALLEMYVQMHCELLVLQVMALLRWLALSAQAELVLQVVWRQNSCIDMGRIRRHRLALAEPWVAQVAVVGASNAMALEAQRVEEVAVPRELMMAEVEEVRVVLTRWVVVGVLGVPHQELEELELAKRVVVVRGLMVFETRAEE